MAPFFLSSLLALLVLHGAPAQAVEPSAEQIEKASKDPYWRKLLHYRWQMFSDRSEADGEMFFLHPEGKWDERKELEASIEGFKPGAPKRSFGTIKLHPQCAFPARFEFVNRELGLGYRRVACPALDRWKKTLPLQSVTMIYSAPFLGNPASMFGHTFMRLDLGGPQLTSPTVGFEAAAAEGGGVGYAIKGVFGLYPGRFTVLPYHAKLRLYTDLESRDVWEYPLKLKRDQADRLLNHLWELQFTYFDYFFFDENCSYHLLSLLEVALPGIDLQSHFYFVTPPADALREIIAKVPNVEEPRFRPSILRVLEYRYSEMDRSQRKEFWRLVEGEKPGPDVDSNVLDAAIEWQKYQAADEGYSPRDLKKKIGTELMRARARSKSKGREIRPETLRADLVRPDRSHPTHRVAIGGGMDLNRPWFGFEFRPSLQSLFESDNGYLPWTELTLLKARVEVAMDDPYDARLQELVLAEVGTVAPWGRFRRNYAWLLGSGFFRPVGLRCLGCWAFTGKGSFGFSQEFDLGPTDVLLLSRLWGRAEFSPDFRFGVRFTPSLEAGMLWRLTGWLKFGALLEHFRPLPWTNLSINGVWQTSLRLTLGTRYFFVEGSYRRRWLQHAQAERWGVDLGVYF
jgi:hypothetical protein